MCHVHVHVHVGQGPSQEHERAVRQGTRGRVRCDSLTTAVLEDCGEGAVGANGDTARAHEERSARSFTCALHLRWVGAVCEVAVLPSALACEELLDQLPPALHVRRVVGVQSHAPLLVLERILERVVGGDLSHCFWDTMCPGRGQCRNLPHTSVRSVTGVIPGLAGFSIQDIDAKS